MLFLCQLIATHRYVVFKYSFWLLHRKSSMLRWQCDSVSSCGLTFSDHWIFSVIKNPHQLPNLLLSVNSPSFYSNKSTVHPLTWGQSRASAWKGALTRALHKGQTCSIALELLLLPYKVTISFFYNSDKSSQKKPHPSALPAQHPGRALCISFTEEDTALRRSP